MVEQEESLIEFPCQFQIKIMGAAADDFEDYIQGLIKAQLKKPESLSTTVRPSKAGNYLGITATLYVHDKPELDGVYQVLSASPRIKMAL